PEAGRVAPAVHRLMARWLEVSGRARPLPVSPCLRLVINASLGRLGHTQACCGVGAIGALWVLWHIWCLLCNVGLSLREGIVFVFSSNSTRRGRIGRKKRIVMLRADTPSLILEHALSAAKSY